MTIRSSPYWMNRSYHPDISRFASDGLVPVVANDGLRLIDTRAEKEFVFGPTVFGPAHYLGGFGWVYFDAAEPGNVGRASSVVHVIASPRGDISLNVLELWVQVALCGQLGEDGQFTWWDEPTWERKRQELASLPAPWPDFPFPGYVAVDRLHWLRQQYRHKSAMSGGE